MKSKRLLVVCQVFYPDPTANAMLYGPLFASMVEDGWEIEVISGYPTTPSTHPVQRLEQWKGMTIRRFGSQAALKKSYWHRTASYVSFLTGTFFYLMRSDKDRIWFGVTNPPFVAWIMTLAGWWNRKAYTYMFLDLHPEGLIALGSLHKDSWYVQLWQRLNRWAYHRAEQMIVLGRDMIPILQNKYQLQGPFFYCPPWSSVNVEVPAPFESSTLVNQYGLQEKFVVQYSGNMGLWHDLETFVKAAKLLESDARIQFLFIGDGLRRTKAEALARELELTNIIWQNFVPIEQLKDSLAACHVSLISLREGLEGVAVPSKLYGILASGRAVLAQVPMQSEVALTVQEHACGAIVEPGNVDALVQVLREWVNEPEKVARLGQNAFEAYKKSYQLAQAKTRMESVLLKQS